MRRLLATLLWKLERACCRLRVSLEPPYTEIANPPTELLGGPAQRRRGGR